MMEKINTQKEEGAAFLAANKSKEGIHMTVCYVMYKLVYGPSACAVRCMKLVLIEIMQRRFHSSGKVADICKPSFFELVGECNRFKLPDRVTWIRHHHIINPGS